MCTTRLLRAAWLLMVLTIGGSLHAYQQALIVQPVVDLVGFSFCKEYNLKDSKTYYQDIPICAKSGRNSCPRLHQLVYNEQVTIIEAHGDEVRIEIPHLFFQTTKDSKQHIGYWTHKSNILPINSLKKKNVNLTHIPEPISFIGKHTVNNDTAILLNAFHDPITGRTYSAGTRFVKAPNGKTHKNHIPVYALMPRTLKQVIIELPKKDTLTSIPSTPRKQQDLFVRILRNWAHLDKGFIPYTWGGCSFTRTCTDAAFTQKTKTVCTNKHEYYKWPSYPHCPFTGFDCAGIIARAAQIAGMPYYFKNTTTIARNLETLKKGELVEPGDIIWFSGHVIVIGDIKRHTAIEARGYDHGFGKIHEIPLNKLFKGITTYQQLVDAFLAGKPLKRLNAQNEQVQTIPSFKILKMQSIWQDPKTD